MVTYLWSVVPMKEQVAGKEATTGTPPRGCGFLAELPILGALKAI